jgi:hypothetical protein
MKNYFKFLLIVVVFCLITLAIYSLIIKQNDEDENNGEYIRIFYTPTKPVEFESVVVYAQINYPAYFLPYLVYNGAKVLMSEINASYYFGLIFADEVGEKYEFWVILIDNTSSLDSPIFSSKHYSFTVQENIYFPILEDVYHYSEQPTENDTITYYATMINARNILYDVILNYNVTYPNDIRKNMSYDMIRLDEGIVFYHMHDPEPVNTTITYSVSIWHKFIGKEITRSEDNSFTVS